jgi:hypothetical protein
MYNKKVKKSHFYELFLINRMLHKINMFQTTIMASFIENQNFPHDLLQLFLF